MSNETQTPAEPVELYALPKNVLLAVIAYLEGQVSEDARKALVHAEAIRNAKLVVESKPAITPELAGVETVTEATN